MKIGAHGLSGPFPRYHQLFTYGENAMRPVQRPPRLGLPGVGMPRHRSGHGFQRVPTIWGRPTGLSHPEEAVAAIRRLYDDYDAHWRGAARVMATDLLELLA